MKRIYGFVAILLVLALAFAGCGAKGGSSSSTPAAKTLTGQGKGYGGTITVTVTTQGDKITAVKVDAPDETPAVGGPAIQSIPEAIVAAGTVDGVEAVSGATYTSQGILNAVKNALDPEAFPFVQEEEAQRTQVELTANGLKTGFGAVTTVAESTDHHYKSTTVAVGLTLDRNGKVVAIQADATVASVAISSQGKVELAKAEVLYPSAKEAKDPTWTQLLAAFEADAAGKTLAEIRALDATGARAELIAATEKAITGALSLGAQAGDKLGLGLVNLTQYDQGSGTRDATADKEGQVQTNSSYAVATFAADGTTSSVILDAVQVTVKFDVTGKLTTDITSPVPTKLELRDKYGLKGASGIGKEYFQQAWAIADWSTGKTPAQVNAISVNERGGINQPELATSATISLGELGQALTNAAKTAK